MPEETSQQVTAPTSTSNTMDTEPVKSEVHAPDANGASNGVQSEAAGNDVATESAQNEGEEKISEEHVEQKHAEGDNEVTDAGATKDEPTGQSGDSAAPETPANKSQARRKSGVASESKNKKLSKKASKAKLTHTDAKPGDYFLVRLKGYPPWPAIICDEAMLPTSLLKSRPVTAARADGTYRDDYKDGGPKVKDRTFPVMYLFTNEFGWIPNYDLIDVDMDTIGDVPTTMRKDLFAAHKLAAEKHNLDYFKEVLKNFEEQRRADLEAKEAAKAAKKSNKGKRKSKAGADAEANEDVEMPDAPADAESEGAGEENKKSKTKKRKADEEPNTPQRSDSVKKPKTTIKLNTPKTTNGDAIPKSSKDTTKTTKQKPKKSAAKAKDDPEPEAPKEPELTAEEKYLKKEKGILFLRHRLQRGLLTRDQEPKEEEMKQMSEFVTQLEAFEDLEVSIIRATKINKVLKAILKLDHIPKEEEFEFKTRSQALLNKWNKLLASEPDTPAATSTSTNGDKAKPEVENVSSTATANGTNGPSAIETGNAAEEAEEKNDIQKSTVDEPVTKENAQAEDTAAESTA